MSLGTTFTQIVSNCCWVMHALLAIWGLYPDKRHRVRLALLALRFKNEVDPGFVDGSRQLAEAVARAIASNDYAKPENERLAEELLDRYTTRPNLLAEWQRAILSGRAPYFEGLRREDMAFAIQPWLAVRLGCQVPWGALAARKKLALKAIFYQLLRPKWDEAFLTGWLTANHSLIIAAIMGRTVKEVEALQEATAALAAEEEQARASYVCGACDSPDLLRSGEACRLCGNAETVAISRAS